MKTSLIVTLLGRDRPGLVSLVASRTTAAGGNWLESHMAQWAGRFAGVLRLEVDPAAADRLEAVLLGLKTEGLQVAVERGLEVEAPARHRVHMELTGHDHPGIVQDISAVLTRHGVSIDTLETGCEPASMSGEPLFRASAALCMPTDTNLHDLQDDLESLANELMVDLDLHGSDAAEASTSG